MRQRSRRQRAAISQAEIGKKCKFLGILMRGFRAHNEGYPIDSESHTTPEEHRAWRNGWLMARDKAEEKK